MDRSFTFVVFDLDGTLIDSAAGVLSSLKVALDGTGLEAARLDRSAFIGPPLIRALETQFPQLTEAQKREIFGRFREHYDTVGFRLGALYEGTADALRDLTASGIRCYVATNKPARPTAALVECHGLTDLIAGCASPDSYVPNARSKTDVLAGLMADQSLLADQGVFVGDSEDDAAAASACGMRFVAVSHGYGGAHRQDRHPVTARADGMRQVLAVLKEWQIADHSGTEG